MFYLHDVTTGECNDCASDQVIKVFDWIIPGREVLISTNQRQDKVALTNERLRIITRASLWSRKLVTLHSIYESLPHMGPDSDNNQHRGGHIQFEFHAINYFRNFTILKLDWHLNFQDEHYDLDYPSWLPLVSNPWCAPRSLLPGRLRSVGVIIDRVLRVTPQFLHFKLS